MIDFTDKRVYEREQRKYQDFLDNKLVTQTEFNQTEEVDGFGFVDGEDGILDTASIMGGDAVDFGGDDQFSAWGDELGGTSKVREIDLANDVSYKKDTWWMNLLTSPWYLVAYVYQLLVYGGMDKEDWRGVLKSLNKITIVSALIGGVMWITDTVFLISAPFQTITSLLMFMSSYAILKYGYGEGREATNLDEEGIDFTGTNFEEDGTGEDDVFALMDEPETGDGAVAADWSLGVDEGSEGSGELTPPQETREGVLSPSPITIENNKVFDKTLLNVFASNAIYEGVEIPERKKLLESMAGYIITNDKNYGQWRVLKERSYEYNSLVYSLFKGLGQMVNQFLTDEEKMVVMDVRSNPLLFKIEVELPSYFKERAVKANLYAIENILKNREDDTEVSVTCSYYRGIFVFKFLRLDNKNLVSLGDILRFYDETKGETALEVFADDSKGMPVLLGLRENEYPYVLDLEENTSGAIVGGSGSGKSWLTFLLMFNMVLANDYNNVQFIVLDKKNAPFWNQFAKFPHVLGYHTDEKEYLELLREIYAEVDRRKRLLNELGAEDVKGLRKRLRKEKRYEELKEIPLLTVVIDEMTSTMLELETYYEEDAALYKEVKGIMSKITQEGRSLGVRLLLIGQRAIDKSIPKNAMMNSTFKFGMRMENDSEFEIMYGGDANKVTKPKAKGIGLARTAEESGLYMIKTLTVGGKDNDQILKLIRVLALEWVRRSIGKDDIVNPPKNMKLDLNYNRDKFVTESLQDIKEGRILERKTINYGYSADEINGLVGGRRADGKESEAYADEVDEEEEQDEYETPHGVWPDSGEEDVRGASGGKGSIPPAPSDSTPTEEPGADVGVVSDGVRVPDRYWGEQSIVEEQTPFVDMEDMYATDTPSPPSIRLVKDVREKETTESKITETEDFISNEPESEPNEPKVPEASYVDDDDDDLFGDWDGEVVVSLSEEIIQGTETGESKIIEREEDLVDPDEEEFPYESLEEMMAIEEAAKTEDRQREERDRESELLCELSGSETENAVKPGVIPEKDNRGTETDRVHNIGTLEILDLPEEPAKSDRKPEVNPPQAKEPIPEPKIRENQKPTPPRRVDKQEIKRPAPSRETRTAQETSGSGLMVDFKTTGGQAEPVRKQQNIKQYIIENGERDGMRNRRMRCDELESVYSRGKIEQALDMLLIVQDRDWYITKL